MDNRINLEDYDPEQYRGGEVVLKARTLGDRKRLDAAAAKRISTTQAEVAKGDEGERYQEIDFEEISAVLFEISVESWTLDLPLTREAWAGLDEFFGEWLEDQIADHYKAKQEADEERRKARSGQSAKSGDGRAAEVSRESQPSVV